MTGRPRDPELAQRVKDAAILVLAGVGRAGLTMDEVAAVAGAGKASIYRRWRTERDLLVDVVGDLGVGEIDLGDPASTRDDVLVLVTAACTGRRAVAKVALLGDCGIDSEIRKAYLSGPHARLRRQISRCAIRTMNRGESGSRLLDPVLAAVTALHWQIAVHGHDLTARAIEHVVDTVVMPVIDRTPVTA